MLLLLVLAILAALLLAAGTYLGLERLGRGALIPASLRAIALVTLALLLFNASCERPPEQSRSIVLLDASLSMAAAGGQWAEARRQAAELGEIRFIGPVTDTDSAPIGGRSRVASDVLAATASGRPVWLVTDGELEDVAQIPPDLMRRVGVRVLPRTPGPDLALTRVDMPDRVAVGDTVRVQVEVTGFGMAERSSVTVDVRAGDRRWLTGTVPLRNGSGASELETVLDDVGPGEYLVEVSLRDSADAEPRTDTRLAVVTVTPTPGIVIVASPPGWESRFLYRALEDVAALPVRGFIGLGGGEWRRMGDLARVSAGEVEQAARRADVLALLGDPPEGFRRIPVRGRWEWVATSSSVAPIEGDWYLSAGAASPLAGAFVGLPVDSFPPGVALASLTPGPGDWVGLSGQLNRRGAERPAIIGRDSAGRREVIVGVAGLWRWAFRGDQPEQAYRAWVASATTWLLGGTDSATGRARPIRAVAERGQPVIFARIVPDTVPIPIELTGPAGPSTDTLRFDGQGRAELHLPPGGYRYRLAGGGSGQIGVEEYSTELLRRPVALSGTDAAAMLPSGRAPLRDERWLFGLIMLALGGEWWWRRRAGLR